MSSMLGRLKKATADNSSNSPTSQPSQQQQQTTGGAGGEPQQQTQQQQPTEALTAKQQQEQQTITLFQGADKYNIADYLEFQPQPIGRGAFSEVYQAVVKPTQQQVAVKVVPKSNLAKGGAQLQAEVQLMKMIDHPNVVKLICLFEDSNNVYLVLELLTGGELFQRITTIYPQGYPEMIASATVKQILSGVRHLHERDVVHRDLKPENLLYVSRTNDTHIKLTDFGLAKLITEDKLAVSQCGSPSYVAPEILAGKPYGKAVDLWSLGVLTYVLLCGFAPFYHSNAKKLYELIQIGKFHFPSPYFDKVSEDGKDFIRKLLVVDPEDRWTANQALGHQWIRNPPQPSVSVFEATLPGTDGKQWQQTHALRSTTVTDGPTESPSQFPDQSVPEAAATQAKAQEPQ